MSKARFTIKYSSSREYMSPPDFISLVLGDKKEILLTTELLHDGCSVEKSISIDENEPVVYSTNRVKGFKGGTSLELTEGQ